MRITNTHRKIADIASSALSLSPSRRASFLQALARRHPVIVLAADIKGQIDAAALRAARKRKKMTQIELAEKSGISTRQLQNIENGHGKTTKSRLFALAEALEIEPKIITKF